MKLLGHELFGHKPTVPEVNNTDAKSASDTATEASEAAFDRLVPTKNNTQATIKAPIASEVVKEQVAETPAGQTATEQAPDNLVQLPSPEQTSPEDPQGPIGPDHQISA